MINDNDTGWGQGLTIGGKTIEDEPDQETTSSSDNSITTNDTGWGAGITIGGESASSFDNQPLSASASISISIETSITRTFRGYECESVDDGLPLSVTNVGSTFTRNEYSPSCWLSFGVSIKNPNPNLLAYNVQLDVTIKDQNGMIIDVLTEYIDFIDAGATFYYGNERYIDSPNVGQISASAYTNSYYRTSKRFESMCTFDDITRRADSYGSFDVFGQLKNSDSSSIDWCTGYIQFLDSNGNIVGGACGNVNSIPGYQSRPLKINCNVGVNAAKYITSTSFSL